MKRVLFLILCEFALQNKAEHSDHCHFLPLTAPNGRVGTCCLYSGRHRRWFGDSVVINSRPRYQRHTDHEYLPPTPPTRRVPMCHLHDIILRNKKVGICCSFVGRYLGRPDDSIQPDVTTTLPDDPDTTEVTTEYVAKFTLDSRFFINSSCKEGYVLDSNYDCVEQFS